MKESNTLVQSKKNLGQSLRKSALVLGSRVSSCVSKRSDTEKRYSKPNARLIDANGVDLTPLPLLSEDRRIKEDREAVWLYFLIIILSRALSFHKHQCIVVVVYILQIPSRLRNLLSVDPALQEIRTLKQVMNKQIDIADTQLLASRAGNDRYMERGMNTLNNPVIPKSVQTTHIKLCERAAMATVWDMADVFQAQQEYDAQDSADQTEMAQKQSRPQQPIKSPSDDGLNMDSVNRGATTGDAIVGSAAGTSDATGGGATPKDTMVSNSESDLFGYRYSMTSQTPFSAGQDILKLPRLIKDINRMERALNVSTYYEKLLQYQALHLKMHKAQTTLERIDTDPPSIGHRVTTGTMPSISGKDDNSGGGGQSTGGKSSGHTPNGHSVGTVSQTALPASIAQQKPVDAQTVEIDRGVLNPDTVLLWRYQSSMTKGRNISDMAWNKENPNIVAVGYGAFEFENQRRGLVCCWSLKFIEYPERTFETPSSVTAVGWSKIHSNLLAVGMFSGVIYVFDVRKKESTPVIDTTHAAGRHLGAVRKIQWVVRQSGRAANLSEILVSVSTDGRVTEWFVRKGFDSTDLMVLKRSYASAPGTVSKSKRNESLISRTAFGSTMAFNAKDPSIYVVGTEDGPIHKCSCSYNEQYLDTFLGHTAPVYQIEWSPFLSEVFISCSADWTIKLWHLDHPKPLINIQTNISTVSSISWSPYNSIIFASANESALELWNLDISTIEPYVTETVSSDANMTSVLFAESSESVLVGDNQGTVHVYGLVDFPESSGISLVESTKLNNLLQTCIKDDN